ncbi:asmA-like region family protein [Neorickettsia helminthoeca str. Oregon]|uniref:AsmA-like region family protein n=1 Tax=Neorickettsia helminthoeca str. Oregon TaxID=1286528 RepID=X5GVP4_9RICK|nr:AsmA-like C-terminal domain-containing protein [Neorickettsia helminthoeca]AHX11132.1 asmA-like region family protein [Neorickettsia helminthoeca str. Oregon]
MKVKIVILLFLLAVFSPFLVYKYNKNLSQKFVEYYINSRFSKFKTGSHISFTDFDIRNSDNFKELVLSKVTVDLGSKKVAFIEELRFSFHWNFPFTKLYPINMTISGADIEIPFEAGRDKMISLENYQVDHIFSVIALLNTDLFIQNIRFNGYTVSEGFIRIKKMNHRNVLQLGIHEEKAGIELEMVQSQYDTIAVRVTNFDPNESVFSPLIKGLSNIDISNDSFTFSGYAVLNLNEKKIQGAVRDLRGSVSKKIRKESNFQFENGSFVFNGTLENLELNNVKIKIDGTEFRGRLLLKDGLSLEGKIENLVAGDILKYWGNDLNPVAREWYEESIQGGIIKQADIKFESKSGDLKIEDAILEGVKARIAITEPADIEKRFIDVEKVSGKLSLLGGNLEAIIHSGEIDGTNCKGCKIRINDDAIKIEGELVNNLNKLVLLGEKFSPQIIAEVAEQVAIRTLKGKGIVDFLVQIPTSATQEIDTVINIKADNIQAARFYKAFHIENGSMELKITNNDAAMRATLLSSGEKIDLYLDRNSTDQITKFTIKGTSKLEPIKESGFLPEFISLAGKVTGEVAINLLPNNEVDAVGRIGTKDVQEDISQLFGWEKDPGAILNFRIKTRDGEHNFEVLEILGKKMDIRFEGKSNGKEALFNSKALQINDSHLDLSYVLKGNTSNLRITSEAIDLSRAEKLASLTQLENRKSDLNENISIKIANLKLKNEISMNNLSLTLQEGDGSLSGIFSDDSILRARFSKDGGINVDSTNVGTLLKGLGFKSGIIGGRGALHMGTKNMRTNSGVLKIENFYIQDAPILARILSLASLNGIMNILNGEGIFFDRFFSEFKYADDVFYISESWLEATPIGLSVMGILSIPEEKLILHGSVVPLYRINQLISKMPIIGTLLTGGRNRGVIAAEYTLTRKQGKSNVSVHTLTTFTPTVLHKFFKVFD